MQSQANFVLILGQGGLAESHQDEFVLCLKTKELGLKENPHFPCPFLRNGCFVLFRVTHHYTVSHQQANGEHRQSHTLDESRLHPERPLALHTSSLPPSCELRFIFWVRGALHIPYPEAAVTLVKITGFLEPHLQLVSSVSKQQAASLTVDQRMLASVPQVPVPPIPLALWSEGVG